MSIQMLGVKIDTYSKEETLVKVSEFLQDNNQHTIFTPNPEMLVAAHKDNHFKAVLNSGSLNICEGKGIELLARGRVVRFPGIDLMLDICRLAEQKNYSVYFLGSGKAEILKQMLAKLPSDYPQLKIAGSNPGPHISIQQCNNLTITDVEKKENHQA